MKKFLAVIICTCIVFSFTGCFGKNEKVKEPTAEDLYQQLVTHTENGEYLEGWRVFEWNHTELAEYKDAEKYKIYCDAMRAYEAGAITEAYNNFMYTDILKSEEYLQSIENKIFPLNGVYKSDNGQGAYLHIAIEDGKVATGLISYFDENQEFVYEDKDLIYQIVEQEYSDGEKYLAIGYYSSIGAEVDVDYAIETFDDSSEILVIAFEENEFKTFNGLYEKIK